MPVGSLVVTAFSSSNTANVFPGTCFTGCFNFIPPFILSVDVQKEGRFNIKKLKQKNKEPNIPSTCSERKIRESLPQLYKSEIYFRIGEQCSETLYNQKCSVM